MLTINEKVAKGEVHGQCTSEFQNVAQAFIDNFNHRGEIGASLCLHIRGELVLDLWGGMSSKEDAWQQDTLVPVFSCTKAMTAICAHLLIERGELDLSALVSQYWPEYAQNGKKNTTVAMMLNHSSAVPALREPVKENGFSDWDYMCERLAAEEPFWEPGTNNGYHMITFGWTVGELVRRVSGMSLGEFFQKEIAGPTQSDFWIGLPEEYDSRVSKAISWSPEAGELLSNFTQTLLKAPDSVQFLSFLNVGGWNINSPEGRRAEIGGAGGISNGRGLSLAFVPLANKGRVQNQQIFNEETISKMGKVSVETQLDKNLLIPSRFALGFMKSMDNRDGPEGNQDSVVIGENAFGHVGAGGSFVFADPDFAVSMGYAMNKMGAGILLNDRGQTLVDAIYKALKSVRY